MLSTQIMERSEPPGCRSHYDGGTAKSPERYRTDASSRRHLTFDIAEQVNA